MKPYLRDKIPAKLSDIPDAAFYEAGYLVTKNASWRSLRPVIDTSKCTGCLMCYLHCPEGTIYKSEGKAAIDYDFCKGCGICCKMCKTEAIRMEAEP